MNLSEATTQLLNDFKTGKKVIDISFQVGVTGKYLFDSLSIHSLYKYSDGSTEPAYVRVDVKNKLLSISNLRASDLNDPTISKLLALPDKFGEI